eukprot:8685425-Pyramimonas_sp.AAC.2
MLPGPHYDRGYEVSTRTIRGLVCEQNTDSSSVTGDVDIQKVVADEKGNLIGTSFFAGSPVPSTARVRATQHLRLGLDTDI